MIDGAASAPYLCCRAVAPRTFLAAFVAALLSLGLAVGVGAPAPARQDVVVVEQPETKHPRIYDGRVYAIAARGHQVLVGGTFSTIRDNDALPEEKITQRRLFRFSSATGRIDKGFRPRINGDVEAVTYSADGKSILIAGAFTKVNGKRVERLARLRLDGSLVGSFRARASRPVKDFALVGNRLYVGGEFGKFNGKQVRGLVAINATTGKLVRSFHLPLSRSRDRFPPYVQELDVSRNGRWLVIGGNFRRVGKANRTQVAVIDLSGKRAKVARWATKRFVPDCAKSFDDTYIRGIDISPDNKFFVVNTTGAYRGHKKLCDSSSRWELPPAQKGTDLQPTWVNHTGGDTFWAVEVTESAVYVGGHQRWVNNPRPTPKGDNDGPGAVSRPGIAALDPYSGVPLSWNPGRDRGRGVEAFLATSDHLMVGSDTATFAGQNRQRLALLPVDGGSTNPVPQRVVLPVRLYVVVGDDLRRARFDGSGFGPVTTEDEGGWSTNRDGFVQHGRLHYFGKADAFWQRTFTTSTIGASEQNLSASVGYVDHDANLTPFDQPYGVAETRTAAFAGGRILYTKRGDSRLFVRGYSLESGIIGGLETVASTKNWRGARAMELIGSALYVAWNDGKLYRFAAPDGVPRWGTRKVVDNGNAGIPWSSVTGMWAVSVG